MTAGGRWLTLYRVTFRSYDGTAYRLDTTDEAKIGPWLAEMFGLFPYRVDSPTAVHVDTSTFSLR